VPQGFGGPLRVGGVRRGNATGTWCSRKADDLFYLSRNQALVLRCQSCGGLRCFRRCPSMGTNGRLASTPNCAARSGRFRGRDGTHVGSVAHAVAFLPCKARSQMTRLSPRRAVAGSSPPGSVSRSSALSAHNLYSFSCCERSN
jgi:hypothetical protein